MKSIKLKKALFGGEKSLRDFYLWPECADIGTCGSTDLWQYREGEREAMRLFIRVQAGGQSNYKRIEGASAI